jgi:ADP-ribosyl-[dinitrogen reductase] hydrolase
MARRAKQVAIPDKTRKIEFLMHPLKTSTSPPLRIDSVAVGGGCGRIGLTFCPGKKQTDALSGVWDRSLEDDMKAIKAFGALALVTLMPDSELQSLRVSPHQIRDKASELGVDWYQLPIPDAGIPDQSFEDLWADAGLRLRALLKAGHNIVIHCKGGLGRTGTVAARLLIEFGMDPKMAIQSVRKARPGAVENNLQEKYIAGCEKRNDAT